MEPTHHVVRRYLSLRKAAPYVMATLFVVVAELGLYLYLPSAAAVLGVRAGLPYLAAWCLSEGVLWASFFAVGRMVEGWVAWRVRARHRAWVALGPQETEPHRDGEVATIRGTIRALSTVRVHESNDVAAAWVRQRIIRGHTEGDPDSIEIRSAAATFDVVGPGGAIAHVVGGPWAVLEDAAEGTRTMVLHDGDEVIVRGVVRRRPEMGVDGTGYRDAIGEELECEGGVIAPAQPRFEPQPSYRHALWAWCLMCTALFGGLDYQRLPLPPPSPAVLGLVGGCERHTHAPTAEAAPAKEVLPEASPANPTGQPTRFEQVFDSVAKVGADAEFRPLGFAAAALAARLCGPIEDGGVDAPIVEGVVDDAYHPLAVKQPRSTCLSGIGTKFMVFAAGVNHLWAFADEMSAIGPEGGKVLRYASGAWTTMRLQGNIEIVAGASWTGGRVILASRSPACDATVVQTGDPCGHPDQNATGLMAFDRDGRRLVVAPALPRTMSPSDMATLADGTVLVGGTDGSGPSTAGEPPNKLVVVTWDGRKNARVQTLGRDVSLNSFQGGITMRSVSEIDVYAVPSAGVPGGTVAAFRFDGATWQPVPNPCPKVDSRISERVTIAAPGRVWVDCRTGRPHEDALWTSKDDGAHWALVRSDGATFYAPFGDGFVATGNRGSFWISDDAGHRLLLTLPGDGSLEGLSAWSHDGHVWLLLSQLSHGQFLLHTTVARVTAVVAGG